MDHYDSTRRYVNATVRILCRRRELFNLILFIALIGQVNDDNWLLWL